MTCPRSCTRDPGHDGPCAHGWTTEILGSGLTVLTDPDGLRITVSGGSMTPAHARRVARIRAVDALLALLDGLE